MSAALVKASQPTPLAAHTPCGLRSCAKFKKYPLRHTQRGFVAVLLLVMAAIALTTALTAKLWGSGDSRANERTITRQALQKAKDALLADIVTGSAVLAAGINVSTGYTALLNNQEGRLRCTDLNGDGGALGACGTGAGVGALAAGIHSLGLFPWNSLGTPKLTDSAHECLWYAVSGLHKAGTVSPTVNADSPAPFTIIQPVKNVNPQTGAVSWTERILAGNPNAAAPAAAATERVVAVIMAPGSARTNQNRTPVAGSLNCPLPLALAGTPDAPSSAVRYLENYVGTAISGNNQLIALPADLPKVFVQADEGHEKLNDELIWITAEEFANAASKRALKVMTTAISNYVYGYYLSDPALPALPIFVAGNGFYPPAASTPGGACVAGRLRGYVPFSCAIGVPAAAYAIGGPLGAVGAGAANDNWGEQAHYAVIGNCTAANGLPVTMPPFTAANPPSTVCTPGGARIQVGSDVNSVHALILMRGRRRAGQADCTAGINMGFCVENPINAFNVAAGNTLAAPVPAAPPIYQPVGAGSNDLLHLFRQRLQ